MRIQLCSDLHFEFHRDDGRSFAESLDPRGVDVLVLAGDIAVAERIPQALGLLCARYRDSDVVYVHGNHEFYTSSREQVVAFTRAAVAENPNLTWLDNSCAEIRGRRFLGAPLWFERRPEASRLRQLMGDFTHVQGLERWVYEENARTREFLREELAPGDVVVTHHLPSWRSVAPAFAGHPLNAFFVCDLEPLILERRPRLWMHGHTHGSLHYELGATTVLCNPFGYVGQELNRSFVDDLVVEL